jgi:hypothetical protein
MRNAGSTPSFESPRLKIKLLWESNYTITCSACSDMLDLAASGIRQELLLRQRSQLLSNGLPKLPAFSRVREDTSS